MTKTYANTLSGYVNWMKDNPLDDYNRAFKVGNYYLEIRLSEFSKHSCVYVSVKEYDRSRRTFFTTDKEIAKEIEQQCLPQVINYLNSSYISDIRENQYIMFWGSEDVYPHMLVTDFLKKVQ